MWVCLRGPLYTQGRFYCTNTKLFSPSQRAHNYQYTSASQYIIGTLSGQSQTWYAIYRTVQECEFDTNLLYFALDAPSWYRSFVSKSPQRNILAEDTCISSFYNRNKICQKNEDMIMEPHPEHKIAVVRHWQSEGTHNCMILIYNC